MLLKALAGQMHPLKGSASFSFQGISVDPYQLYKSVALVSFTENNKHFNSQNHYYQQRFESLEDEFSKSIRVSEYLKNGSVEDKFSPLLQVLRIDEIMDRKLIQLSSGQRRKLMLANALKNEPKILLLDDPYIGLDASSRNDLNGALQVLSKNTQLIISGKPDDISIGHVAPIMIVEFASGKNDETDNAVGPKGKDIHFHPLIRNIRIKPEEKRQHKGCINGHHVRAH